MEPMERVTIGVVGDPYVGKTMLSVSYTANYVFKEYVPTVLNYYTTTTSLEGRVIDILIWDNSGSDEYADLRPLSYPQTDAFLLCFSLKSRESLENVLSKWLPEIDENVRGRVPIVLVGCKRDKHCGPADDLLANGHVTRVTPPTDLMDMYPYMTKVHFECDQGYEHSPDIPDIEIECLQTNEWSGFTHNCTKIQCANFTVDNAEVVIHSLDYLGTATITCHNDFLTDYGRRRVDVHCQADKTWSEELACTEGHRSNYYKLHRGKTRVAQGIEQPVRSEVDCAAKCTLNKLCTGANYHNDPTNNDKYVCTMFEEPYTEGVLQSDSSCIYLEIS